MKQTFSVSQNEGGQRIDVWLSKALGISRKQVKAKLDSGLVSLNGKKVRIAKWALKAGDRVAVRAPNPGAGGKRGGFVNILMDDRHVMVVEKPSGILSVAAPGEPEAGSMLDRVREYIKRKHKVKHAFVSGLHRLDVETSGVMVFAVSKDGERVRRQFADHTIVRRYFAVVDGQVEKEQGVIKGSIEKGKFTGGRKARVIADNESISEIAKDARTDYRVVERYENATLLDVMLHTGRTHQIRVHLASIGHPVVGDRTYGSKTKFPRQALHAYILGFRHPVGRNKIEFKSALPNDMQKLIDRLRGIHD